MHIHNAEVIFHDDPILLYALNQYEISSLEELFKGDHSRNPYYHSNDYIIKLLGDAPAPKINVSRNLTFIHHSWNLSDGKVLYDIEREGCIVTIKDRTLPEAILSTLPGKLLSTVVDVPGSHLLEIEIAVNSRAFVSDPLDLRMSVRKI